MMCADAGIVLAYLPPYSPDFNPIEEAFAELKAWIKKNRVLATSYDSLEGFLRLGIGLLQEKAKGHFMRCRIGIPIVDSDDDMEGDGDDQ